MSSTLVSIIIPVFNLESYIKKCIDSLINQTFSNIEIIIVDDGSTDSTSDIIEELSHKDSRIKLFKGNHGGTAAARRLGIQNAQGEYLTFVDGDDWMDIDGIETMVTAFSSGNCDLVVAQHRKVFLEDPIRYEYKDDYPFDTTDTFSFMDIINERRDFTLWAKMFKKTLFDGIIFHEGVPIGQDGLVLKQVILKSLVIKAVNKIVYNYLYRQGSAMRKTALLINKLIFLKGNFNNLTFYKEKLYNNERDRLISILIDLGVYYLKMNKIERELYSSIWSECVYSKNLHVDYKNQNPKSKNVGFIKKYSKLYSFINLIPIYGDIYKKKLKF